MHAFGQPDQQETTPAPASAAPASAAPASAAPASVASTGPAQPRALNARTVQFYARDWAAFAAWCRNSGVLPLPSDPSALAAYLTAAAARCGPGTLARHLSAIADQHRRYGLIAPTKESSVQAVLRTARRSASPRREPPPSPAALARMIAACPGDLAGLRDRALLSLMAASGLGRAALVSLDAENIRIGPAGIEGWVGEAGGEKSFRLSRDPDFGRCPVRALEAWLRVSETRFGPVFRKIDRWGNVAYHRLGADAVRRILARRAFARPPRRARGGIAADPVDPA
jgi:integrase